MIIQKDHIVNGGQLLSIFSKISKFPFKILNFLNNPIYYIIIKNAINLGYDTGFLRIPSQHGRVLMHVMYIFLGCADALCDACEVELHRCEEKLVVGVN